VAIILVIYSDIAINIIAIIKTYWHHHRMKFQFLNKRFFNLQMKISILIFFLTTGFSLAIGYKMSEDVKKQTFQITAKYIESIPFLVNSSMYNFMLNGDRQSIKRLVLQLQNDSNIVGVHVFNKDWDLTKAMPEFLNMYDESYLDSIVANRVDNGFKEHKFDGKVIMSYYSSINNSQECRICHLKSEGDVLGHININIDLTHLSNILAEDAANVRQILLFTNVLLFLVIIFVVNYLVNKPVKKLEGAMQEVANNNLEVRLDVESEDEFGRMSRLFNYMVYSLRKSFQTISNIHKNMMHNDRLLTIGTLTAAVSHEIKNPLNSIMLNCDILAMKNKELADYTQKIQADADRIKDIIDNTLNFSRIDDEQSKKEIDLNVFISELRLYVERTILKWTDIPLEISVDDDLGYIFANPVHLEQIFINILRNAVEAVDEIESPFLVVRVARRPAKIVVSISDNGKGIPESTKDMIFSEFYTTKSSGTGIGLYIVKELVEKYNGEISFESAVNKGTTFHITLPVERN
jgi:signal transduction histidine kinase